jgi:hypothetical protein
VGWGKGLIDFPLIRSGDDVKGENFKVDSDQKTPLPFKTAHATTLDLAPNKKNYDKTRDYIF